MLLLSGCKQGSNVSNMGVNQQQAIDAALKIAAMPHPEISGPQVTPFNVHAEQMTLDQAENRIQVDGKSGAPLLVGHVLDGYVFDGPDAVVGDENVDPAEMLDRLGDQGASGIRSGEAAGDGVAVRLATFFDQRLGLRSRLLIAEYDLRARRGEHADRGCADAAGTTGD